MGRPSKYTEAIATEICIRIMAGEPLIQICRDPKMPCERTVYTWLEDPKREEFLQRYVRARERQAERMADEIMEISDDSRNDWVERENKDGTTYEALNGEHVQRSKLRTENRKWLMSKLLPKKYGDRVSLEHSGPEGGPIPVDHRGSVAGKLDSLAAKAAGSVSEDTE